MDAAHQERIAANEARFREINDKIVDAVAAFDRTADASLSVLCECAVTECADMIDIRVAQYTAVRAGGHRFIVRPDHVLPAAEEVVERHEHYWVVEKPA